MSHCRPGERTDARLPNLVVIGAQKAGTTWLREALNAHPDIFMADGEPQYFNRHVSSFEQYCERFAGAESFRICGEKTPDYLHMSRLRIQQMKRQLGSARIIAILRRPDERSWSQARMEESTHNRSALSEKHRAALEKNVVSFRNFDRSRYAHHLAKWRSEFGCDRVFIGFFDDMVTCPQKFLRELFIWLGVDPELAKPLPGTVWKSPEMNAPPAVALFLRNRHRGEVARLKKLGVDPPAPWADWAANGGSYSLPLFRRRIQMLPENLAYRTYNWIRGFVPGSYESRINQVYNKRRGLGE